jgi:formylglycine-generating enzyme required for sulfatase activity
MWWAARAGHECSADDAQQYVAWLSRHTGKLSAAIRVRVGICRARRHDHLYSFGDDEAALNDHAWYKGNSNG